jgi:hypothetical protein
MAHDEFSREDIPSEGVSIGGDEDCDHETYRRFGSDGGGNIYFRCTNCSNVILNYDSTDRGGREPTERSSDSSETTHDPLVKGLSLDSDDPEKTQRGNEDGLLARIKSDLDDIFRF